MSEVITIRSLKHDGSFYRKWLESHVLERGDPLIVANYQTKVVESDGSERIYPHLSICLFFRQSWYNVVIIYDQPSSYVPHFYCNLASPYQIDWERKILDYIDYEIDIRVSRDYLFEIVDLDEYERAKQQYRYPLEVQNHIRRALYTLTNKIENRRAPFAETFTKYWYHRFFSSHIE